jgi:hypothetical protein
MAATSPSSGLTSFHLPVQLYKMAARTLIRANWKPARVIDDLRRQLAVPPRRYDSCHWRSLYLRRTRTFRTSLHGHKSPAISPAKGQDITREQTKLAKAQRRKADALEGCARKSFEYFNDLPAKWIVELFDQGSDFLIALKLANISGETYSPPSLTKGSRVAASRYTSRIRKAFPSRTSA